MGHGIVRLAAGMIVCGVIAASIVGAPVLRAATAHPMTVRIHVTGDVRLDRFERFPADLHDTGCTLIRSYAPPGKPHTYSYTVTINEAGRHFQRDTFYLTVDPFRRGQTVYTSTRAGRFQLFSRAHNKSVVISAFHGIPGLHLRFTLAPDLRSGTAAAMGADGDYGGQVGLHASMTVQWSCPVLFNEHYG